MDNFKYKLLNVLLLPAALYKRISDKRTSLLAGIAAVGLIDLFLPDFMGMYKQLFYGKAAGQLNTNIAMAIGVVLLLGIIDVVFFSVPLHDIFRFMKRKEAGGETVTTGATRIKAMKIYIIQNLMLAPVNVVMYYVFFSSLSDNSPGWLVTFFIVYFYAIMIWQTAIVTRGFNSIFEFNPIFRRLTFIVVFTWTFILGTVFSEMIIKWVLMLFK